MLKLWFCRFHVTVPYSRKPGFWGKIGQHSLVFSAGCIILFFLPHRVFACTSFLHHPMCMYIPDFRFLVLAFFMLSIKKMWGCCFSSLLRCDKLQGTKPLRNSLKAKIQFHYTSKANASAHQPYPVLCVMFRRVCLRLSFVLRWDFEMRWDIRFFNEDFLAQGECWDVFVKLVSLPCWFRVLGNGGFGILESVAGRADSPQIVFCTAVRWNMTKIRADTVSLCWKLIDRIFHHSRFDWRSGVRTGRP